MATQTEKKLLANYLEDSSKTLSGKFYYDEKHVNEPDVYHFAKAAIKASEDLDLVKKKKYYGKPVGITSSIPEELEFNRDNKGENLLHAAIGIVTEAGELLDAVMKVKYEGKELDAVNVKEEIGDVMWYMAILLRDLNIDLYEALDTNIAKLRARYGESFSPERAINRNLTSERQVLENGIVVTENRDIPTGGMKPPKNLWTSYAKTIDITDEEKRRIKKEMAKKLGLENDPQVKEDEGALKLEDIGIAFNHFENYNGSFMIKLLSTEAEIIAIPKKSNIDLKEHMRHLKKGQAIALSIYDFQAKKEFEQDRFVVMINFDQMTGILKFDKVIGPGNTIMSASNRQLTELTEFLTTNNIEQ